MAVSHFPADQVSHIKRAWWVPFRHTVGISVFHVDLHADPAIEHEAYDWLDLPERLSSNKGVPQVRRSFVLCRAALRAILCRRLSCRNEQLSFGTSEHGKPFALLDNVRSAISFNVSHSGNHGLIAVANKGRIGVDIEVPRRNLRLDAPIEATMGPEEQRELAAKRGSDQLRLFCLLWTCKEALIKALGTGFSTDASQFQIPLRMRQGDRTGVFRFPHFPSIEWGLEQIGNEQFAAAIAYELPVDCSKIEGNIERARVLI